MTGIVEAIAISAAVSLLSAGLTYALTPTQKIQGSRLSDLTTAKSNYGAALPWCWGTVRVGGNTLWSTFLEETSKKQKQGKGAKVQSENYSYYGSFATAFCECPFRPLVDIPRLWANKDLVYSKVGGAKTIAQGGKFAEQYLRFYYGNQIQNIDPLLANTEPISNYSYGIPAGKSDRDAFFRSLGIDPNQTILTPGYNRRAYVVAQRLPLEEFYNRLPGFEAELIASQNCSVGQILGDIFGLFYESDRFDTTLVDNIPVDGFFLNSVEAAKNAVQSLQQAYFFDIVGSGRVIKFIPLNHPRNIVNLSVSDLAAHAAGTQKPLDYEIEEEDTTSLPSQVKVTYIDKDLNYDQNEQSSSLEVRKNYNKNITILGFNIVMTGSQAATIADRAMFLAWVQYQKYKFSLPPAYLDLEPSDLVANLFDDSGNPIKLTQVRTGVDFSIQCEGVRHDTSFFNFIRTLESGSVTVGVAQYNVAITTTGTPIAVSDSAGNTYTKGTDYTVLGNTITPKSGGAIAAGTNLVISTTATPTQSDTELGAIIDPGDTQLLVLDIPLITDSDADYTVYLAASGGDSWSGASIYVSTDNSRYTFATTIDTHSVFGATVGTLGATGSVTVQVNRSELESITESDLALGFNLALVGNEIIQFKTAQLTDVNTYLLSELTRGLRGTEPHVASHAANERFVLLTGTNAVLGRIIAASTDIGQRRYFKALSAGQSLDEVTPVTITYLAIAQRPYAPVNLAATKNAVGDITITWQRRDRHAALQTNNPPLSESTEGYLLNILDTNNAVVRNTTRSTSSYTYQATEQVTDFNSLQASITVEIAQVSSIYGIGSYTPPTELTPLYAEPAPTIDSVTPASALVGATITITGMQLAQVSEVKVGDIVQSNLAVIDNENITFNITNGTVSAIIKVTTTGGTAFSPNALIIEAPPQALVFPIYQAITLPYTITPNDAGKELTIDNETGLFLIPDLADGFAVGWGCWVSLDGMGTVTFERESGGTAGIKQSNPLGNDDTVKLWHRGSNVWKID